MPRGTCRHQPALVRPPQRRWAPTAWSGFSPTRSRHVRPPHQRGWLRSRNLAATVRAASPPIVLAHRQGANYRPHRRRSEDLPAHCAQRGATFEFETDMGQPRSADQVSIETTSGHAVGTNVSMGNPHFVIFVIVSGGLAARGGPDRRPPRFPGHQRGVLVVRGPNEIEIRLFERGVGETQSSGTGSCASAVAAIASQPSLFSGDA